MKDRQIEKKLESSGIPLVSPLLHIIAMPALVILRRDFGLNFLRPKSILIAICWAMLLFAIYSFFEPAWWNAHPALYSFIFVAGIFYVGHLLRSFFSQWTKAPHDQFAGSSWFSFTGIKDRKIALIIEPLFILALAFGLQKVTNQPSVERGFIYIATAMFSKQFINSWGQLRKVKQQLDATSDAEETMEIVSDDREGKVNQKAHKSPPTTRKKRANRQRHSISEEAIESQIETHAIQLRMMKPYSLKKAEENYHLLKTQLEMENVDNSIQIEKLNAALEFYQDRYPV